MSPIKRSQTRLTNPRKVNRTKAIVIKRNQKKVIVIKAKNLNQTKVKAIRVKKRNRTKVKVKKARKRNRMRTMWRLKYIDKKVIK